MGVVATLSGLKSTEITPNSVEVRPSWTKFRATSIKRLVRHRPTMERSRPSSG